MISTISNDTIEMSKTVKAINVTVTSVAFAAMLLPTVGFYNNQNINNNNYLQATVSQNIELSLNTQPKFSKQLSYLLPSSEEMIKLKNKIEKFVINPKVDNQYIQLLHNSINDSLSFLTYFHKNLPLPTAYYAEDGEIILEWFLNNNKSVIISIEGDGYYGYTFLQHGKYVAGKVDGDINKIIPQELYDYFLA